MEPDGEVVDPEWQIVNPGRLARDLNGHVLDQYINPGNPFTHYDGTAEELVELVDEWCGC